MSEPDFLYKGLSLPWFAKAVMIRETEMAFLQLFAAGKLHGTVHTCVGQEFCAVAFAGQLQPGDFIFSNHRGHGHYLAFTNDVEGLIAELMGKQTGVCGGIGSSQHLCAPGFFTNGIQGGIVPCATGHALALRCSGRAGNLGVVFIGDGTLGEGVVYESLNLMSLLEVPLLVVCEDNGVAQSTQRESGVAGDVKSRARAFGLPTWEGSTDDPAELIKVARQALESVRQNGRPAFFHVTTARLNAHSKGDDERPLELVKMLWAKDALCQLEADHRELYAQMCEEARFRVRAAIAAADTQEGIRIEEYMDEPAVRTLEWNPATFPQEHCRQVARLQRTWAQLMAEIPGLVMIGEDIRSPYGGAFKVTKGLSDSFPERVISTPISESAITGIANGMALAGMRPVVEIMFGDFITLALDQLLNHAAKFNHMYNRKAVCPMVLRTPMGGGRGYGPTHSQSLEKLVVGIDTIITVALNVLVDPDRVLRVVMQQSRPVVIIENKLDYGRYLGPPELPGYYAEETGLFPVLRLRPQQEKADVTLVTYGGSVTVALEAVRELFLQHEVLAELLVLTQIGPVDDQPVAESVRVTGRLVTIEEGTLSCGIGAELIARVSETVGLVRVLRIGSLPVPIPSPVALEAQVLPGRLAIVDRVVDFILHD